MKNVCWTFSIFFLLLTVIACGVKKIASTSQPITHEIWNDLVTQHVTEDGQVNYKGLVRDSLKLNTYLQLLSKNHPNDKNWTPEERLAYWLNAYNAFTVKLIVQHYPIKSIKDIKKGVPFINTVWDIKFINIEGQTYDLNNIEHSIIRTRFDDPRIHFAANCAAISCPKLRNEAYSAEKLDAQLDDQAYYFLRNPVKNQVSEDKLKLSKIFKWYARDFKSSKHKSIRKFIELYGPAHNKDAGISYLDYSWKLNERQEPKVTED